MTPTLFLRSRLLLCAASVLLISACAKTKIETAKPGETGASGPESSAEAKIDFTTCARPGWPEPALRDRQQGVVTLEFAVGADGGVKQSRVVATSFHALLDQTTRAALAQCRFHPARERGRAVEATVMMQYAWKLPEDRTPPAGPPEPLRVFVQQAREADAILDPVRRCLSFPDFPGNAWPEGLAQTYCDFTAGKHVTVAEVSRLLERKQLAELDALFKRDLERHFSRDDFSEVIHNDLRVFSNADQEANRVSAQWVEIAPESAFANAARGNYLFAAALAARGDKWASDTPRESMGRMSDFAGMAAKFLAKALRIEPRLMPVYATQVALARVAGIGNDERVHALGTAVDPGCYDLARQAMYSLLPRWGGSYAQMNAFSNALAPRVPQRPLLALAMVLPHLDRADLLQREHQYDEAVKVLKEAAKMAPLSEVFTQLGRNPMYGVESDWGSLVSLLSAYRFSDDDIWAAEERGGRLLNTAHDVAWSVPSLRRAAEASTGTGYAQYWFGMTQLTYSEYARAETNLTVALAFPEVKADAAYQLILTAAAQDQMVKAGQLADTHVASYPDDPRGHFMQGYAHMRAGRQAAALAGFTSYLRVMQNTFDVRKMGTFEQTELAQRYIGGDRDPAFTGAKLVKPVL